MNIKGKGMMMAAMAAMAAMIMSDPIGNYTETLPTQPISEDERKRRYNEVLKKKGVQEFVIAGETILARNYKNALRKWERKYWRI